MMTKRARTTYNFLNRAIAVKYDRLGKFTMLSCVRSVFDTSGSAKEITKQSWITILALTAALSVLSYNTVQAEEHKEETVFRRSDVAKHTTLATGIWVTYDDGVYDITKFVANHPGGSQKIMTAAGKDLSPFWNLYRQHFNSATPLAILDSLRIGRLHEDDLVESEDAADMADPYINDPELSPIMVFHSKTPINAEAPGPLLTDSWITPTDLWFVRNHHPVPDIDVKKFVVDFIDARPNGNGLQRFSLKVEDLPKKFKPVDIVASLQCGGNRRLEMNTIEKTNGSPWATSAMSTAKWTGVRLRDVLLSMGITDELVEEENSDLKHVHFVGEDGMEASIPIKKAMARSGDVLLAYKMNDTDIPRQHGYPLRLVVPGHVGVRNVKWVKTIRISHEEAHGTWQRGMAYKGFSPSTKSLENIDVEKIPSLQEQPIQSVITVPGNKAVVSAARLNNGSYEPLQVQGYSYSGGGRGIVRVDVSIDGGKTWKIAKLTDGSEQPPDRAWAWTFWRCSFEIEESMVGKPVEIICKATDVSYNVQPDSVAGVWNLRGINNNAWHRHSIDIASS